MVNYPTDLKQTDTIQNYSYNFNPITGNLNWRQNNKHFNLREDFQYDNLDRLTNVQMDTTTLSMTYASNGNISFKSDAGTFNYKGKPYTISSIDPSTGLAPADTQSFVFTSFESISSITEKKYDAHFIYDSDNERVRMIVKQNGNSILTRWYPTSSYIKETEGSITKEYTFIGGDAYSAPVVAVTENGATIYYDILRDYLGSITHVVNSSTNALVAEYSYDAWGRQRDPISWVAYSPGSEPSLFVAGRGFTGHEHLPWFNLINMNGRVYDALNGSFLSPDPVVQKPGNSQGYNRYSYCMNNPLRYIDPSGYTWFSNFGDWLGSSGKTLLITAVACAVGIAVASIPGLNVVGVAFVGGMLSGAASGGLGAALNGGDVFSGAVTGGIMGAGIGLATLGVGAAIGYGLNSTFPNLKGAGLRFISEHTTLQGSVMSMLPKVGSVVSGVSNGVLSSSIIGGSVGGILSTNLFPRPQINPICVEPPYLVYDAKYTGTGYRSEGYLSLYNGNGQQLGTWSATSGSNSPLKETNKPAYSLPSGDYSVSGFVNQIDDKFKRGTMSDGFWLSISPESVWDPKAHAFRTELGIHPARSNGTAGCVGLNASEVRIEDFEDRIFQYLRTNHDITLRVNIK